MSLLAKPKLAKEKQDYISIFFHDFKFKVYNFNEIKMSFNDGY
jgi:hypothetical protein